MPLLQVLLLVLGVRAPFGVLEVAVGRLPLPAAVKQIAEEEDAVRVELPLQLVVGAAEVVVGDEHRQRVERPRAAGVRVRVDELRVGDEGDAVRLCAGGLDT